MYRDMWVDPGDDPHETDVETIDERGTVLEYLRYHRLTLEMNARAWMPRSWPGDQYRPSTMSLLGLVRHTWPRVSDTFAG